MWEFLSIIYFVGLVMFAIAYSTYIGVVQYGFMIVGGGMIIYALVMGLLEYLLR